MHATADLFLPDAAATEALGAALADRLGPGDAVFLLGPVGAGKSHLARALIRARLGDPCAEVPSPTFTLVQTYADPRGGEIWHADLYRLTHPDEGLELGLDEAFSRAITLVEWPERLGPAAPVPALAVTLAPQGEGRAARLAGRADLVAGHG
jgi:tRNA threonylcarbamoyladenosine biosynthesis protein TsaE